MYERLTHKNKYGRWVVDFHGLDGRVIKELHGSEVDRLAAYEDGGLSPEEVQELAKAKAEGRLVVLSTPMIPLVESDDPMDSDVYCPACGVSVSGGWPDYHPDLEWKMCQCFYCGQSIDDTKVITREEAEKALGGTEDEI